MLQIYDISAALQIAVIAVTFSEILTQPGMILERVGGWLYELHEKRPRLAKPLGYCAKCFAGQIAFWSFPVLAEANPFAHLFLWATFVSLATLSAAFLSALYHRATR